MPIPKHEKYIRKWASKYTGVSFHKPTNKWTAQITIEGKRHFIGYYENEEEAAADYARAVFKYKGEDALDEAREQNSDKEAQKRRRDEWFVIDLSDVPPQLPIPKSKGHIKEGASKYTGVSFHKPSNKWQAQIMIEGKKRHIGYYENEEDAAADFARAKFKYKGQDALDKKRGQKKSAPAVNIDLSNVPSIPPILKSAGGIKEGSSKYTGVTFNKAMNKWEAQIIIEGKQYSIGYYENEVFAAIDYARAVLKYQGQRTLDKAREQNSDKEVQKRRRDEWFVIDLSDVPPQLPIPKSVGLMKEGASKYAGVHFRKAENKWIAKIAINGKRRHIGYYKNEEEAAIDYARAIFKYRGQDALDKAREQNSSGPAIDLSDVPPQPPIPKKEGHMKEGSSKYVGVHFDKSMSKWKAAISIDGKQYYIGCYENEEDAAIDYARAFFKYKGQDALDKAREQNTSSLLRNGSNNEIGGGKKCALPLSSDDIIRGKEVKKLHNKNGGEKKRTPPPPSDGKGMMRCTEAAAMAAALAAAKSWNPPNSFGRKKSANGNKNETVGGKKRALPSGSGIISDRVVNKRKRTDNKNGGEKKRPLPLPSKDMISGKETAKKCLMKADELEIDLTDVPPQLPILKSAGDNKEGSSKYVGVSFHKPRNKWQAQINIDGKLRHIGSYESEGLAAIDYARAVFKYHGQETLVKAREAIDLSDILIGYARAVFKYKGEEAEALEKARELKKYTLSTNDNNNKNGGEKKRPCPLPSKDMINGKETAKKRLKKADKFVIDLADVPPQLPILKSKGRIKDGASKYMGVSFHKPRNKWRVSIMFEGKHRYVGSYESEEEAAVNYARAVFKYQGQEALEKARETIDLSDVPPQLPIPKSGRYIKDCTSIYTGVSFDKSTNKWQAKIWIDGTKRHIGRYDNEEEAAIDYARAVFKYK